MITSLRDPGQKMTSLSLNFSICKMDGYHWSSSSDVHQNQLRKVSKIESQLHSQLLGLIQQVPGGASISDL